MLGIELSYKASIGPGLRLFHGVATVIHESVVMGKHCTLRHSTTIGMRHEQEAAPILGDNVDVGCQSVIIGPIRIGNGVTIGAGSVVLDNLPNHAVAVGNPARILKPVFKVAAVDDGEEHDLTGVGRANCLKQLEGRANLHQAIQPTGLQSQSVYEILEETIPTSAGMTFDTTQSIATAVDVENRFL
jgi:carbonic anhydrase/acetyltransferase-like protein (isoleucine patch superfamily)